MMNNYKPVIYLNIFFAFVSALDISAQNFWDNAEIDGPYRIVNIAGLEGIHLQNLNTKAILKTNIQKGDKGTLSIWVSPLEEMTFSKIGSNMGLDYLNLSLVSDAWPIQKVDSMSFGLYWNFSYPQLIGRFTKGRFWTLFDYGFAPMGYAEKLTLRTGQWYHIAMTWDKTSGIIALYANGERIGYGENASNFMVPNDTLYFGNPMMVFHDIQFSESVIPISELKETYQSLRPEGNDISDNDINRDYYYQEKPPLELSRDASWQKTYEASFMEKEHLDAWHLQTGDKYLDEMDIRITDEGLLVKTPNIVAMDTRIYLWSPVIFEGDQWIEFDFRLESDAGLSLLTVCATGPQRNDFIEEGWMEKTGSMGFILGKTRNYHWEFMRRVENMRRDMETQYLAKNPWASKMYYGCIPKLDQNEWYRLRFVKTGNRLHGSINGITVFDLVDSSFINNGPILNSGRIGIRQMYNTSMSYKNFSVYTRQLVKEIDK